VAEIKLRELTVTDLVSRLKNLQRTFDSGAWDPDRVLDMLVESKRLHAELRSRGLTDLKIEWLLCERPMA